MVEKNCYDCGVPVPKETKRCPPCERKHEKKQERFELALEIANRREAAEKSGKGSQNLVLALLFFAASIAFLGFIALITE